MGRKSFSAESIQHLYLRVLDRGVLFYSVKDRLVYYTICATQSRKHCVQVCAASLMFTHIHQSVRGKSAEDIRQYLQDTNSAFARLYNHYHSRTGSLFDRSPGQAPKYRDKDKRSNIVYVYNNHVEKGLCSRALDERWSFISYAFSDNPFSHPIPNLRRGCKARRISSPGSRRLTDSTAPTELEGVNKSDNQRVSRALSKALNLVDRRIRKNKALEYADFDRIFPSLDPIEIEQFIDYVISRYKWIDFDFASSHFQGLEAMVTAIESTTGREFDISEEYDCFNDLAYSSLVEKYNDRSIFAMTKTEKLSEINKLLRKTSIPSAQLFKFFHYK